MAKTSPSQIHARRKASPIHQVARQAGVSIATVSRVFAGSRRVSPEAVERAHQPAQSLSYQPDRIARNLRTQINYCAAMVVSDLECLENQRAEGVAGVILAPTREDLSRYEELVQTGMVIITIDLCPKNLILDQITVNNSGGACSAVRHLVEQGHTQIGFIYGLPKIGTSSERLNGFRLAVQSHGLCADPSGSKKATFAGKMASNVISYG